MPEVICNTSPLQYLHQIGQLSILPALAGSQILMLALEMPGSIALLDDALARRVAIAKGIPIKGTLGLLLDGKRAGHLTAVKPSLDRLQELGFRLSQQTREAVLKLAGEL